MHAPGPQSLHLSILRSRPILLLMALLAASSAPARADELRVLAAGATESTLRAVLATFEAQSGHALEVTYGAVGLLRDRVFSGERADLVIVTPAIIQQLEAKALLRSGSRVDLGRVGGGIAVRAGERLPAVGSPEELKQALLAAEAVYYADPATATAGAYFLSVADKLGVGEAVRRKGHTAPGGKEAMRQMAASRAHAIGLTQVSEILSVKEVVLVGPYPAPLQGSTTYSGVIPKAAAHPEAAQAFLGFLMSPPVQERFRKAGFEAVASAPPATYPGQKDGDFVVKDFRFQNGETLPEVRLHYTTLGTPRRNAAGRVANAVLLLHGTSSTSKQWLGATMGPELFGPGQPLDASRYYVILPDGLGRGGSTKPSEGLRAKFPRYGYGDVVTAQHLLVTKGLGVDHLRAVIGTSMGGMHTWMWAERYPEMMDGAMPIACQPVAVSGRNLLFRRILSQAIRNDPDWQDGEYKTPPRHWLYTAPLWPMMLESPVRLQHQAPTRQATLDLYDKMMESARKDYDANDFLYWVESSWDYDPQADLGKIRAKVVAVNFGDDAINPPELAYVERLVRSVPGARFVLVPASDKTLGHLSLRLAALWKPYLEDLLR